MVDRREPLAGNVPQLDFLTLNRVRAFITSLAEEGIADVWAEPRPSDDEKAAEMIEARELRVETVEYLAHLLDELIDRNSQASD